MSATITIITWLSKHDLHLVWVLYCTIFHDKLLRWPSCLYSRVFEWHCISQSLQKIDWIWQKHLLYLTIVLNWHPSQLIDIASLRYFKTMLIGFDKRKKSLTSQVFSCRPSVRAPFLRRENALLSDWRSCKEFVNVQKVCEYYLFKR